MNLYTKWSLFIAINLPVSLLFALDFMKTIPNALAVVCAVGLFVFFYARFDNYLYRTNKIKGRMALKVAVISCAILLLYPAVPMIAGAMALELSGQILNVDAFIAKKLTPFAVFLTTVIDGFLLSSIVAVLMLFARILFSFKDAPEDNKI